MSHCAPLYSIVESLVCLMADNFDAANTLSIDR